MQHLLTRHFFFALIGFIAISTSCTRGIEFGEEIIAEEFVSLRSVDTFSLSAKTIANDSTRTFSPTNIPIRQLVGSLDDPIFGKSSAASYFQLGVVTTSTDYRRFENATLDSITLTMLWDSAGFYGSYDNGMTIDVFEVSEDIDMAGTDGDIMNHFADESPAFFSDPIGSSGFVVARTTDKVTFRNPVQAADSTIILTDTVRSAIQIRLDDAFGQKIIDADTVTLQTQTAFREFIKGMRISSPDAEGMVGISMANNAQIDLYYSYVDTAGISRSDNYIIDVTDFCNDVFIGENPSCVIFNSFEHDYTGTALENIRTEDLDGDSLLYLQGMIGTSIELELPSSFDPGTDILVNKAELLFTVDAASVSGSFEATDQIIASYRNDDDELSPISDLVRPEFYDGVLTDDPDTNEETFTLNITSHMQSVLDGELSSTMVLIPSSRAASAARVVLRGTEASEGKVGLRIIYTEL